MRRLLLIGLALVLLAGGALVLSPMLIPSSVYKAEIAKAVERATGRAFKIDGGVKLAILPKVSASLERAALANVDGGKAPAIAEIGRVSVGLKLWPLLARKFEITSFVLEDALIHLEVDQKGNPNWKFEGADKTKESSGDEAKSAKPSEVSLGDVRLVNGHVTYDDAKSGASYDLSRIGAKLALPGLDSPLKIDGEATYNEQPMKLTLKAGRARALLEGGETSLTLDAKSTLLNASFDGSGTFGAAPSFAGDTKLDTPSVRKLGKWLGKPIAGSTGFGPLSVSGKAKYDDKTLSFANAELHFDAIDATGGLTADLSGALPRLTGHLSSPKLDLRPYTGGSDAAAPVAAAGSAEAKDTQWSNEPIDASALRSFNARLTLSADQVLLRNLKIGKSDVVATVEGGVLTTDVKELGLYNGTAKGKLVVDGRKTPSSISSDMSLSGLDLASFMADAAHSSRFEGIGNFDVDLRGSGHSQKELVENLGGATKIAFKNGAIKGIDLAKIAQIIQGLTGKAAPGTQQQASEGGVGVGESTKFVAMGANFAVASGIMRTSDFQLLNDILSLTGEGSINLVAQTIDFKITPGKNQKDGGLRIALKISGPLSHPKITPDASDFLKNELEKRLGTSSPEELLQQILTGKKSTEPGKPDEPAPVQKLFDKFLGKKKSETPPPAPSPAPAPPQAATPSASPTETAPAPAPIAPQTEGAPAPSAPAEQPAAAPATPPPEPTPAPSPQASAGSAATPAEAPPATSQPQ
ncbi:MAG: AsmA family protein [Alphaproteobacteria bacterium]